jgi:hypothetical protein
MNQKQFALREQAHAEGFRVKFIDPPADKLPIHIFSFTDSSRPVARCLSIEEAQGWLAVQKHGEP